MIKTNASVYISRFLFLWIPNLYYEMQDILINNHSAHFIALYETF